MNITPLSVCDLGLGGASVGFRHAIGSSPRRIRRASFGNESYASRASRF